MSTTLIINFAFLVGFLCSFKFIKKLVKDILRSKRKKSKITSEETDKFRQDMIAYYKRSSERYKKLGEEVNEMMQDALSKAESIIEHNRKRLDQKLDSNTHANLKKVTDQFEKTIGDVKANTANIAAEAVKKIMDEHQDDKFESEVISSLSRDLNKKLH
ncbi:MAG: ATP synthase subunit b [Wolbachia endosymbiont of Ctenocephalides orientis wCori]|nr:MAG: ATP synthase subunit b [Wolbachia endosymbiont of Ctenocephalides orientis wCori]